MRTNNKVSLFFPVCFGIFIGLASILCDDTSPSIPKQCGVNEAISPCLGVCTNRTCANLNPPIICPRFCQDNQCDCIDGYRRLESGECVPEYKCPNYCPHRPNEVKYDCYNECSPRTCPNVTQPENRACTKQCQIGVCDCINGYLRNECGVCVPQAECASGCRCPSNNEEIKCINSCSASTCEHVTSGVLRKCVSYCSKTCECKQDYARDANGYCIPEEQCCEYS